MKKKMIIAAVLAVTTVFTAVVVTAQPTAAAFAANQKNEYGCQGNCTGEYEIRHVISLLSSQPDVVHHNIRIKAKMVQDCDGYTWLQDLDEVSASRSQVRSNYNHYLALSGMVNTTFSINDNNKYNVTVGVVGDVIYTKLGLGGYTLSMTNATIYMFKDNINYKMLPEINYIA